MPGDVQEWSLPTPQAFQAVLHFPLDRYDTARDLAFHLDQSTKQITCC